MEGKDGSDGTAAPSGAASEPAVAQVADGAPASGLGATTAPPAADTVDPASTETLVPEVGGGDEARADEAGATHAAGLSAAAGPDVGREAGPGGDTAGKSRGDSVEPSQVGAGPPSGAGKEEAESAGDKPLAAPPADANDTSFRAQGREGTGSDRNAGEGTAGAASGAGDGGESPEGAAAMPAGTGHVKVESSGAGKEGVAASEGQGTGGAEAKAAEPASPAKAEPKENPLVPPKRPGGAYILFFRDKYRTLKEEDPSLSNPEVTAKVGALWRALDEEAKQPYLEQAAAAKREYEKALARYREFVPLTTAGSGQGSGGASKASAKLGRGAKDKGDKKKKQQGSRKRESVEDQQQRARDAALRLFGQGYVPAKGEANAISPWDEENGWNEVCEMCGEGGDIMLCDYCNVVWHPTCLRPALQRELEEDERWACPECAVQLHKALDTRKGMQSLAKERKELERQLKSIGSGSGPQKRARADTAASQRKRHRVRMELEEDDTGSLGDGDEGGAAGRKRGTASSTRPRPAVAPSPKREKGKPRKTLVKTGSGEGSRSSRDRRSRSREGRSSTGDRRRRERRHRRSRSRSSSRSSSRDRGHRRRRRRDRSRSRSRSPRPPAEVSVPSYLQRRQQPRQAPRPGPGPGYGDRGSSGGGVAQLPQYMGNAPPAARGGSHNYAPLPSYLQDRPARRAGEGRPQPPSGRYPPPPGPPAPPQGPPQGPPPGRYGSYAQSPQGSSVPSAPADTGSFGARYSSAAVPARQPAPPVAPPSAGGSYGSRYAPYPGTVDRPAYGAAPQMPPAYHTGGQPAGQYAAPQPLPPQPPQQYQQPPQVGGYSTASSWGGRYGEAPAGSAGWPQVPHQPPAAPAPQPGPVDASADAEAALRSLLDSTMGDDGGGGSQGAPPGAPASASGGGGDAAGGDGGDALSQLMGLI